MTYGIAKQNLKEWFDNDGIGEIDAVDFILALNALDKQIPKKVNISLNGTTDWNTKCHCPNCHSMVSHGKYCSNCGQALDFSSNGSDTE